jgi:hypothetical protein
MPKRILLKPAFREYRLHREQYEALATDLEGEGALVRVLPAGEERDLQRSESQDAGVLYDLTIQVGEVAGEIVGTDELVEMVRAQMRKRHEGRDDEERRAKIYLANGQEHEFIFGDVSD